MAEHDEEDPENIRLELMDVFVASTGMCDAFDEDARARLVEACLTQAWSLVRSAVAQHTATQPPPIFSASSRAGSASDGNPSSPHPDTPLTSARDLTSNEDTNPPHDPPTPLSPDYTFDDHATPPENPKSDGISSTLESQTILDFTPNDDLTPPETPHTPSSHDSAVIPYAHAPPASSMLLETVDTSSDIVEDPPNASTAKDGQSTKESTSVGRCLTTSTTATITKGNTLKRKMSLMSSKSAATQPKQSRVVSTGAVNVQEIHRRWNGLATRVIAPMLERMRTPVSRNRITSPFANQLGLGQALAPAAEETVLNAFRTARRIDIHALLQNFDWKKPVTLTQCDQGGDCTDAWAEYLSRVKQAITKTPSSQME
ncbi:hypothetical protein HBI56_155560 [Parastagonospora nodorum]|uniref:Uncharacterized protein n=1 Tax=Phaeosphaeria nodorum (strain SN15 / ATCC MYA-4574 / FGSC 10173) TaxID=321614 RepID=A0A7U2I8N4_PHANO|nr:hypothetical protein HBH56_118260 [Parastagonospora nodorum]QRD05271.1 hypothetical protein JI435_111670 [Parastagonospora nodorum SN15]KAH3928837.1 hypothetical protein HBH54_130950 [Parastagonospora nodorum]KAH3973865.1 hypothetical protein HBH52_140580 [Parastagonospora nodorum]KAH3998565.1 hypothetical protein HBI10_127540 [Parastagonospora nodorum]